jgi:hypothetical protein
MKLEDQVCSLDLAKRLKELGVKQESYFFWWATEIEIDGLTWWELANKEPRKGKKIRELQGREPTSAFTVAELGDMLPAKWGEIVHNENGAMIWIEKKVGDNMKPFWEIRYFGQGSECLCQEDDDIEANARAKMLIWLLENKLVYENH